MFATLLALLFEEGVMLHDVEVDRIQRGEQDLRRGVADPAGRAGARPAARGSRTTCSGRPLTGPLFLSTLAANATANVVRNVWAFSIIFCGHFPAGTHEFTEEECEGESKGHWYFRQMLGSANITGGSLFHILSGNLSHQIEHHLFPDLPARRYPEIADEVQEICERYGLPVRDRPLHPAARLGGRQDRPPRPARVGAPTPEDAPTPVERPLPIAA